MGKLYQVGDIVKVKKLTQDDIKVPEEIEYSEKEVTLKNFYGKGNWNTSLKNDCVFHEKWIDSIVKRADGKYKVGDVVKVNQTLQTPYEVIYKNKVQRFTKNKQLLKIITIKEVIKRDDILSINYNYTYKDTDDNLFTDWMLDGLCEEEKENNYLEIAKQLRVPNNKEELEKCKLTASLLERGLTCENILCANCIFNECASIKCYKENKQKRAEILKEYVNLYKDYFKESVEDKQKLVFTEEYYEQAKQIVERLGSCFSIPCRNCFLKNKHVTNLIGNYKLKLEKAKDYIAKYNEHKANERLWEVNFSNPLYRKLNAPIQSSSCGYSMGDSILEEQKQVDVNIKKLSESKIYENKEDDFKLSNKSKLKFDNNPLSYNDLITNPIFIRLGNDLKYETSINISIKKGDDFKLSNKHKLKF